MNLIATIIFALGFHSVCLANAETMDLKVDVGRPTQKVELTVTYQKKITSDELSSDIFKEIYILSDVPIYNETKFRILANGGHTPSSFCKKLGYEKGYDSQMTYWASAANYIRAVIKEDLKIGFEYGGAIYVDIACLK